MAMVECPECASTVSDRAKACVNCGFPIEEHHEQQVEIEAADRFCANLGPNPDFSIGKQATNWGGTAAINLHADFQFGELGGLEPGAVKILRFTKGLKLLNSVWKAADAFDISFLQIVEIKQTPAEEVVRSASTGAYMEPAGTSRLIRGSLGPDRQSIA